MFTPYSKLISIDTLERSPKKVQELTNSIEIALLGNIDTVIIKRADRFVVKLFVILAGALEIPETHGVYFNVLISVSEYDENPDFRVFSVGPFIGPIFKNDGTDLKDRYIINVENGDNGKRKNTKLTISLDKVLAE